MCELIGPLKRELSAIALDLSFQLFSPLGITQHVVKALEMPRVVIAVIIILLANAVCKRCTSIGRKVHSKWAQL